MFDPMNALDALAVLVAGGSGLAVGAVGGYLTGFWQVRRQVKSALRTGATVMRQPRAAFVPQRSHGRRVSEQELTERWLQQRTQEEAEALLQPTRTLGAAPTSSDPDGSRPGVRMAVIIQPRKRVVWLPKVPSPAQAYGRRVLDEDREREERAGDALMKSGLHVGEWSDYMKGEMEE